MACECYTIGGPWIAENPNCPEHGTEAVARRLELSELRDKVTAAKTVEVLRAPLLKILELVI